MTDTPLVSVQDLRIGATTVLHGFHRHTLANGPIDA